MAAGDKKPFIVKHGLNVPSSPEITAPYSTISLSGLSSFPSNPITVFSDLSSNQALSANKIVTTGPLLSARGNTFIDIRDLIATETAGVTIREVDGGPTVI